ncbi:hypothetical protein Tco_0038322 [Tanacetum coccineum]
MVISSPCLTDIKNWLVQSKRLLLASPKQTALGKDFSNPLIVDSLLKTIWLSMHHVVTMKHWLFQSKRLLAPPLRFFTSVQEDCKRDYPFKEWLLTKVGHTDVSELVKKALLKSRLIDCFREELAKDPRSRSFDDYKWVFDLEIDQSADELGIGKKGHMLDDIWENCKKVQGDNTYWWHDHGLEEDKR